MQKMAINLNQQFNKYIVKYVLHLGNVLNNLSVGYVRFAMFSIVVRV